jgi:hypothetical protein
MGKSLSKKIRDGLYGLVIRRAPRHVLKEELVRRQMKAIVEFYGPFTDGDQFEDDRALNSSSESGYITGNLVHSIRSVSKPSDVLLLAGERRSAREGYSQISGIDVHRILTAGLHEDMDYEWNYEDLPPAEIPAVDLIASHAMIEHLIDPYKHLKDCFGLLKPGGHMIVHSVVPGFQYHRYPVDCLRFFPDWFEEVAQRLNAQIVLRIVSKTAHLVYTFRKPT